MKLFPLLVVSFLSALPSVARADEPSEIDAPPSSGLGLLITGAALTGVGALNLATSPLCKTSLVRRDMQNTCFDASLVFGGALAVVGIPLLVVGVTQRSTFHDWKRAHPVASGFSLAPLQGGAAVGWSATF